MHTSTFAALDPVTLYQLLQLRADIFVVEQQCPYRDADGRDLEQDTRHLWIAHEGKPVSYLRRLREPDAWRIGRVCTAAHARGRGLSGRLLTACLDQVDGPYVLDAQSHLIEFYRGFGFAPSGAEYVEDGIPHTPMRRQR